MDPLSLVELARTLVDIDSTTGAEGDCGRWLAAYLRARGWRVEEQPVTDTRCNVLANWASSRNSPNVSKRRHPDPREQQHVTSHEEIGRCIGRGGRCGAPLLASSWST